MPEIRFTLLSDGSSDKRLLPLLRWALQRVGFQGTIQAEWADFGRLRWPPRTLAEKIVAADHYYPADLLFVHRDAESQGHAARVQEIQSAVFAARNQRGQLPKTVQVIPVRMQEAWLLFNEAAIRRASGNPNGRVQLDLPPLASLESITDPKELLYSLLRTASELSGRRLRKLHLDHLANRVVDFIEDYSPIETLPAFARLLTDLEQALASQDPLV